MSAATDESSCFNRKFKDFQGLKATLYITMSVNFQNLADNLRSGGLANARRTREKSSFVTSTIVIATAD